MPIPLASTAQSIKNLYERSLKLSNMQLSPTVTLYDADMAKEYGFNLDPGWGVKVDTSMPEQPRYTYVSPDRWEFTDFRYGEKGEVQDYKAISPDGNILDKTLFEAQAVQQPVVEQQPMAQPDYGTLLSSVFPDKTIDDVTKMSPEEFSNELMAKGKTEGTQALLLAFGNTQEEIDAFYSQQSQEPKLSAYEQSLMKALPKTVMPETLSWAVSYFGKNPDQLRGHLITAGRNTDTEALVKSIFPKISERGLDDYFKKATPSEAQLKTLKEQKMGLLQPKGGEIETLPGKNWLDRWKELKSNPTQLVPFVASGVEIVTLGKLLKTALDFEAGKDVSEDDMVALKHYVEKANQDVDWSYQVADILAQLPAFAGELLATGGIFSVGKAATVKAGTLALKRIATKTGLKAIEGKLTQMGVRAAGVAVGGTLQTIPAGITRIPAATLTKQIYANLPEGNDEPVWKSAVKALGEQWVETVSERSGGMFGELAAPVKGKLLRLGFFKAFQKANPGKNASDLSRIAEKMGWHGTFGEMGEEQVALVGHGVLAELGLGDQKFQLPSVQQLGVELVAFSVPGVAMRVANELGKYPAITNVLAEERGSVGGEVPKRPYEMTREEYTKGIDSKVKAFLTGAKNISDEFKTIVGSKKTYLREEISGHPDALIIENRGIAIKDFTKEQIGRLSTLGDQLRELRDRTIGNEHLYDIRNNKVTVRYSHGRYVKEALSEGKTVPAEVLKDYPELAKAVAKPEVTPPAKEAMLPATEAKGVAPEVTIPKTEPGQPEAGLQQGMFGGQKVVRPKGKGVVTQTSMDEQLKLQQQIDEANKQLETKGRLPTGEKRADVQLNVARLQAQKDINEIIAVGGDVSGHLESEMGHILTEIGNRGTAYHGGAKSGHYVASDWTTKQLDEMVKVYQESQAKIAPEPVAEEVKSLQTKPLEPLPEQSKEELTLTPTGEKTLTPSQVKATCELFGKYVESPNAVNAWKLTRELRRETRAGQAERLKARAQELIVEKGVDAEEGMHQAIREALSGELPSVTTDYLSDLTDKMRVILFNKVYTTLKDEPFEMASTLTALTNALTGNPISREPGVKGGSAFTRLQRVFGDQPQVLKAIEKMAEEKKPLKDVVEGIYHETGQAPIPIDQATADYLRGLQNVPLGYKTLLDKPFVLPSLPVDTRTAMQKRIDLENFKLELTPETYKDWTPERIEELSYLRVNLLKTEYQAKLVETGWTPPKSIGDQRTPAQRAIDLDLFKIEMAKAPEAVTPYDTTIKEAIKATPHLPKDVLGMNWPTTVQESVIRILKEMGWSPVDIGNLLRAMKSSVDMSYWRQIMPLIPGHPVRFAMSNVDAWKGMFSQKEAEAQWLRIKSTQKGKLYAIYDALQAKDGRDFLRPLDLPKGTAQWKGVEEYGYLTKDRLIPRLTAKLPNVKLSNRGFVSGCNSDTWGIFEDFYKLMLRKSELYASGELTLKPGETFDIMAAMDAEATKLADWTGRATLGKLAPAAPEISAFVYAPRYAVGRAIGPRHLFSANPYVRKEAWKDAALFVGVIGGLVLLGRQLDWWDVETDVRSADFMKIRIGKLHIDPWGGAQQFAVFFAKVMYIMTAPVTGVSPKGISSTTGMEYPLDFKNLTENFIKSKEAPLAAAFLEYMTGKTYGGEKIDVKNLKQWADRIAPMTIQDIYESIIEQPETTVLAGIISFVGFGVQTYTGDWKDNIPKLGLPKYSDNLPYGVTEPSYDWADLYSDTAPQFKGVNPDTLTIKNGFDPKVKLIVETARSIEKSSIIPNQSLISMNVDPMKGGVKTPTFADYYKIWQARQRIVAGGDEKALKEFDADERNNQAYLGNFSQSQYVLLTQYWSETDKKKQVDFLKLHPELSLNLREEWLKSHPEDNAMQALAGKAKVLTQKAYDIAQKLIVELDIPANAVEQYLPPEEVAKPYFERNDIVEKFGANSWEDKLHRAKNPDMVKWINKGDSPLGEIDTPIASLELKTKPEYRKIYDQIKDLGDSDSATYIADEKVRAEAVKKLKTLQYIDDTRRIEAIEKGTETMPVPESLIKAHVELGKMTDQEGVGSSSAEVMLYRVDNIDYDKWRQDKNVWGDSALKPIDQSRIPIWRIDVKYADQNKAYEAIKNPLPAEQTKLREAFLAKPENESYRKDRRRREAYDLSNSVTGEKFPPTQVENYVTYKEIPNIKESKRAERFVIDNPEFSQAMYRITGSDIWLTKPQDVPNVAYDDIYDKYKDLFDEMRDNSDFQSPYYIQDTKARAERDKQIFAENPAFKEDYYRRQAYGLLFPDNFVENYTAYNLIPATGYSRERYLKANQAYYFYARKKLGWTSDVIDFAKVPTEEVENLYNLYQKTDEGKKREDFRYAHQDLDKWLVLTKKVSKSILETYRERGLTPKEKFTETVNAADIEFDARMQALRDRLAGVRR